MSSFTVHPVLWDYKKNTRQVYPIKIAVTVDRKVTYILTEYRVHISQWDKSKRVVIGHDNAALINVSIRIKISEIEKEAINRTMNGLPLTPRVIKAPGSEQRSFYAYAKEVREDKKELNRLKAFATGDLMLSDVDVRFLRQYEQHERSRGMSNNTLNSTFKYLRRIILQAKREKLILENPFEQYLMVRYRQTDRIYLTEPEMKTLLFHVKQSFGSLQTTGYYFLLGCYTGLRHSDWCRLDLNSMVHDGYIRIRAKKNKRHVVVPIGKTLAEVLDALKDHPKPVSNQKCNVMLKALAMKAGINKQLSTHAGRHSFGYLCASNRIPKSVTAELLGVSVKTVEVYYHLSGQNIIDQSAVLLTL